MLRMFRFAGEATRSAESGPMSSHQLPGFRSFRAVAITASLNAERAFDNPAPTFTFSPVRVHKCAVTDLVFLFPLSVNRPTDQDRCLALVLMV